MNYLDLNQERTPKSIYREYKSLGRTRKQIKTLGRYMKNNGSPTQKKIGKSLIKLCKKGK